MALLQGDCIKIQGPQGFLHPELIFSHQGVFANIDIPGGTLVLREIPILNFNIRSEAPNFSSQIPAQEFVAAYNRLSHLERAAFERLLANGGFRPPINDGLTIVWLDEATEAWYNWAIAAWYSNCLAPHSETTWTPFGVPIVGSRFRHSCRPNVNTRLVKVDEGVSYLEFRTTRLVAAGTQLHITYDTPGILGPAAYRQARLLARKGIQCNCASCTPPTVESDQRRLSALPLINKLADLAGISKIKSTLAALKDEEVNLFDATLAYDGHKYFAKRNDCNNAMLWLDQAREANARDLGPGVGILDYYDPKNDV